MKYQIEDHSEQQHFEARAPYGSKKPFVGEEVFRGLLVQREQLTWLRMKTFSCIPATYESQCMQQMVKGLATMHIGTAWTRPEDDFVLIRQNMNNYMDKLKRMKQELEETKGVLITFKKMFATRTNEGLLEELVTSYILFDDPKVKFRSQLSWQTTAGSKLLGSLIEIYKTPEVDRSS